MASGTVDVTVHLDQELLDRLKEHGHKVTAVWTAGRNAWRVRVVRMDPATVSAGTPRRQYVQAFSKTLAVATVLAAKAIQAGRWRHLAGFPGQRWGS